MYLSQMHNLASVAQRRLQRASHTQTSLTDLFIFFTLLWLILSIEQGWILNIWRRQLRICNICKALIPICEPSCLRSGIFILPAGKSCYSTSNQAQARESHLTWEKQMLRHTFTFNLACYHTNSRKLIPPCLAPEVYKPARKIEQREDKRQASKVSEWV